MYIYPMYHVQCLLPVAARDGTSDFLGLELVPGFKLPCGARNGMASLEEQPVPLASQSSLLCHVLLSHPDR